jgi:hypothetical protein
MAQIYATLASPGGIGPKNTTSGYISVNETADAPGGGVRCFSQTISGLAQVEAVGVHHLHPRGDEVVDELPFVAALRVNLSNGAQLRG